MYSPFLTGYQAHLQVLGIWLRGEIAQQLNDMDAIPKPKTGLYELATISNQMYSRLEEHYTREPDNPFYAYMIGLYSGNMQPAIDLCLDEDMPMGSYVPDDYSNKLAEWIWSCGLVLESYEYFR